MHGYVVVAMYLKLFAEVMRILNGVNRYPRIDEGLPAHPIKDFCLVKNESKQTRKCYWLYLYDN